MTETRQQKIERIRAQLRLGRYDTQEKLYLAEAKIIADLIDGAARAQEICGDDELEQWAAEHRP